MAADPKIAPESSHFVSAASLRVRLDWFNKLRWGAAVGVLVATLLGERLLAQSLPLRSLLMAGSVLVFMNLGYVLRNLRLPPTDIVAELRLVKLQMLGDLLVLTILLNLTGGVENPLLYIYVVHVILASLLFKGKEIYQIAWLAIGLFTAEVMGEYLGWLPHHHLLSASDLTHQLPFIVLTLASFWLVLLFCAYMGASIMKHNRAIKDELVDRQAELIAADRSKMDFFRFVTHEIKSPVNTAQSAVETALEVGGASLDEGVQDMLSRAVRRLEQATDIVKDLADLTRGGGGLKQENLSDVDLGRLAAFLLDRQKDVADRTGQNLELETPQKPVIMHTNQAMLEKILDNLVSNAVRYNREGGRVLVQVRRSSDRVCIVVGDEGIGIAPEDRERIFEEFYRSTAAQRKSTLGTGLGLAIVRRFMQELGGHLDLDSEPGRGATFTVEFPLTAGRNGAVASTGGKGHDG